MSKRNASAIIEGAYKIIGVFSETKPLEGFRGQEGLDVLNELLDSFSTDVGFISYFETLEFALTPSQKVYTISKEIGADVDSNKLVTMDYVVLEDGSNVQFPVNVQDNSWFYDTTRTTNLTGRPRNVLLQESQNESTIEFDRLPDQAYTCKIKGKFKLTNISNYNEEISVIPPAQQKFLKFALAKELAAVIPGSDWPPRAELGYKESKKNAMSYSDLNLDINISSGAFKRSNTGGSELIRRGNVF